MSTTRPLGLANRGGANSGYPPRSQHCKRSSGAVPRDTAGAFEELSNKNGRCGNFEFLKDWPRSLFAFCAASDGKISAPKQLRGIDLHVLADGRGELVGANFYAPDARRSITSLESKSRWGNNPPLLTTSNFLKVGDEVCGANQVIRFSEDSLWLASVDRGGWCLLITDLALRRVQPSTH